MRQHFFFNIRKGKLFSFLLIGLCFLFSSAQKISAVENYAINRPGVVMIKTVFSANVYVNKMKMDNRKFNQLLDSIQRLDKNGAIFSAEQKLDIVLEQMNNNPSRFFKATLDYIKQGEEITSTGTGFFITGDGYVATNCHLIDLENGFIRRQFILSAFQQITEDNITALQSSWATTFTEQQRSLLNNTYASVYSRLFSMVLNDLKKDVFVVYSGGPGKESVNEKKQATIVIKGMPMPGKDIAILKIDGDSSLPTLKISEEKLPQVGEQLYVYGYPSPVTNNDFVSVESALEPTLTTGIVSAIKNSVFGWPVIQMDANINHGSSGGPVCNEKGEVVGLTTFGSVETRGGLAAGLNFAIPVSILNEYLDTANITPSSSRSSQWFAEGIHLFEGEYYRKALVRFEEIRKFNNHYPGLTSYIEQCNTNIRNGEDKETVLFRYDLLGFSILLVLVLILYVLLKKRKSRNHS
jgi:serine protease Do